MTEYIEIVITFPDRQGAEEMARELVELRLAASGQVFPISSTFRWNGHIETAEEFQLVLKSCQACFEDVVTRVSNKHQYQVPEIIARPIVNIADLYENWLFESIDRKS